MNLAALYEVSELPKFLLVLPKNDRFFTAYRTNTGEIARILLNSAFIARMGQ